jgi:hypothetical protein
MAMASEAPSAWCESARIFGADRRGNLLMVFAPMLIGLLRRSTSISQGMLTIPIAKMLAGRPEAHMLAQISTPLTSHLTHQ